MNTDPPTEDVLCPNCGRPIVVSLYWKHLAGEWGACAPRGEPKTAPFALTPPPDTIPPRARRGRGKP